MMRRVHRALMVLAVVISLAGPATAAEIYKLDKGHSYIDFKVRHMGVSSVRGEFKEYQVRLRVDESNLANSTIELMIDASSIDTDNQRRDDHLRSADFLEVETFPTISFKSKSIEKTGDGEYRATGELTIHGVTREVVLEIEVAGPIKDPYGNLRLGVEGGVTINRHDYEVNWNRVMDSGGLVVGDEVRISFALEAARKAE